MTPAHEAELYKYAQDNSVLKTLLDLRRHDAATVRFGRKDKPMSDEDFYHLALITMTDVENVIAKCYRDCTNRTLNASLTFKDDIGR